MTDRQGSARTPSRLARAVRLERDRKGWTSEQLAKKAGVSHSWVRNFEAGIIQNPGADRLRALEEALGLRLGELYAASLNVPYDKLVADILEGQTVGKAPWEKLLEIQGAILEKLEVIEALADPERSGWVENAAAAMRAESQRRSVATSVDQTEAEGRDTGGPGGPAFGSSLVRDSEG